MTRLPASLETPRLLLRHPTERDVPFIVRGAGDFDVSRWLGRVPYPYVARHARQWLEHVRNETGSGRLACYAITRKACPDRLIGVIGWDHLDRPSPSLGYWLSRPAWGRGYASEAAGEMVAALLRVAPAAEPVSAAMVGNTGSMAVLRKSGFREVRPRKWHYNRARRRKVQVVVFKLSTRAGQNSPAQPSASRS